MEGKASAGEKGEAGKTRKEEKEMMNDPAPDPGPSGTVITG